MTLLSPVNQIIPKKWKYWAYFSGHFLLNTNEFINSVLTTFIIITEKKSLLIIDKIRILKWRKIAI